MRCDMYLAVCAFADTTKPKKIALCTERERERRTSMKRNEMSVNYDLFIHIPDLTDNLVFIVSA